MIDVYMERFEHPYLLTLVPISGLLLGLAVVADLFASDLVAGFLTLYAVVALIICAIGYLAYYTIAYSTEVLRRWRIRNSGVR